MADHTKIEWTDATINPIRAARVTRAADGSITSTRMGWHCEHVSEGCRNCYAEALNRDRFGTGLDYKPGHVATGGEVEIVLVEKVLTDMLRWRRPRRIFVCSMTDLFGDFVPDMMIDRVFAAMALAPQHTFQVLTKRPERMLAYLSIDHDQLRDRWYRSVPAGKWPISTNEAYAGIHPHASDEIRAIYHRPAPIWPLPNVMLGVTAEDQSTADARIPILLDTPAAQRFVSIEPMLGAVDLMSSIGGTQWIGGQRGHAGRHSHGGRAGQVIHGMTHHALDPRLNHHHCDERCAKGLDWVICGGESGPRARPMHPDWARSLRDQCAAAGVPFLFKQWGEWVPRRKAEKSDLVDARESLILSPTGRTTSGLMAYPDDAWIVDRVGKARAGRLLDGVEHNAFPEG